MDLIQIDSEDSEGSFADFSGFLRILGKFRKIFRILCCLLRFFTDLSEFLADSEGFFWDSLQICQDSE